MDNPRELRSIDDIIHNIKINLDKVLKKAQEPNVSDEELKRYSIILIGLNQILTGAFDLDY